MSGQQEDEDPQPTTAVILLGEGIFFQPEAYVLCLSIFERSALVNCLKTAAADESLETLHLIVQSNQVDAKYDPDCVAPFVTKLKPGGQWTTHLMLQEFQEEVSDDAIAAIKESIVLGGLRIQEEATAPDGTWTIVGLKPGGNVEECEDDSVKSKETTETENLAAALESKLHVSDESQKVGESEAEPRADERQEHADSSTIQRVADWIRSSQHILVLTGAGVSVSAGIPDFRTPGTGLYDNLQKYNLPYAEAVFDIDYYTEFTPQPFVQLAADLWPSSFGNGPKPTLTHCFVALLHQKQKLLRNYSQNIDGLEHMAGIPADHLVECHGHFRTASCTKCRKPADIEDVRQKIVVDRTVPKCQHCNSYVKPDIVFFGESLPPLFHKMLPGDARKADLCLILGTSLHVPPVANIPDQVHCKRRILVNRELVGTIDPKRRPDKDIFCAGDCDESIIQVARTLGWEEDLRELFAKTNTRSSSSITSKDEEQE